jgi:propanediol utilization protein
MNNIYRGPSIHVYASQVSVHLAEQFHRRRFFRNQPIRNKNCLWWPCLFRNRAEMNNIYRGPSIHVYASQVSVHLAEQFHRRRFFRNQPIRNKNCLWRPCLLTNQAFFIEDLPMMLPSKFRFIWPRGFRGEDFLEIGQLETRIACGGNVC